MSDGIDSTEPPEADVHPRKHRHSLVHVLLHRCSQQQLVLRHATYRHVTYKQGRSYAYNIPSDLNTAYHDYSKLKRAARSTLNPPLQFEGAIRITHPCCGQWGSLWPMGFMTSRYDGA
jgi:hypothetical protein